MKSLGLLGGMSWKSTLLYYRLLNRLVGQRLGGLHSARLLLSSVDFHEYESLQSSGAWLELGVRLAADAAILERAGAQALLICSNTMHRVSGAVEAAVGVPLLHITDVTAAAVRRAGIATVGLLGTRFTMQEDFYRDRLADNGLRVLVPSAADCELVHRVILKELCLGKVVDASRQAFRDVIARLEDAGAEGIILGCTELGMLVTARDTRVPVFDTTEIHAQAAVDFSLA